MGKRKQEKLLNQIRQLTGDVAWTTPKANFDAVRGTRRLRGWRPTSQNTNSILTYQQEDLNKRSRDLIRNNPYAKSAMKSFTSNVIGSGIKPSSLVTNPKQREDLQKAWLQWTDEADADGLTDFYGLQAIIANAIFTNGEVFVRIREKKPEDGLSVPLQLQLLGSEMCPTQLTRIEANGNSTRSGIEFNKDGKRVAYWFYPKNPLDSTDPSLVANSEPVRVPADQVYHIFEADEPGQLRGVVRLSSVMTHLKTLDDYDDAELERKRMAALYAGFITKQPIDSESFGEEDQGDGTGVAPLEPGLMQILLPGEGIEFSKPGDVGLTYDPFQYRMLTKICAGIGMPYAAVTGDLKAVNYSSARSGLIEFRRRVEQLQFSTIVFQFCRPVWKRWMDLAVLSGRVTLRNYLANKDKFQAAKWVTPAWAWVDPQKDLAAEKIAVDQGWKARSDVIESFGYDPEEVDMRIKADQDRAEKLGLKLGPLEKYIDQATAEKQLEADKELQEGAQEHEAEQNDLNREQADKIAEQEPEEEALPEKKPKKKGPAK